MGGRGWVTNQRLGAAKTDCEFAHCELVEKGEGFPLAASDIEGERRAWCGRLSHEDRFSRVVVGEETEIIHIGDLLILTKIFSQATCIGTRALRTDLQRFERAQQHPAGIRVQLGS